MTVLQSILLIDDDEGDNFFHRRAIVDSGYCSDVIVAEGADEAIEMLRSCSAAGVPAPDLIFVDINMPAIDGWGFLELYARLSPSQQAKAVVVLSTSENPRDFKRAQAFEAHLIPKPLSIESLGRVIRAEFPGLLPEGQREAS